MTMEKVDLHSIYFSRAIASAIEPVFRVSRRFAFFAVQSHSPWHMILLRYR